MTKLLVAAVVLAVTAISLSPGVPTQAAPVPEGCERVPIFGLDPQIRKICDEPIQPDGSWVRARQFVRQEYVRSSCFGNLYQGGCPNWAKDSRDITPGWTGPIETYVVTPDTIPPGEPPHLG